MSPKAGLAACAKALERLAGYHVFPDRDKVRRSDH
jgi:hypothetical protein